MFLEHRTLCSRNTASDDLRSRNTEPAFLEHAFQEHKTSRATKGLSALSRIEGLESQLATVVGYLQAAAKAQCPQGAVTGSGAQGPAQGSQSHPGSPPGSPPKETLGQQPDGATLPSLPAVGPVL